MVLKEESIPKGSKAQLGFCTSLDSLTFLKVLFGKEEAITELIQNH